MRRVVLTDPVEIQRVLDEGVENNSLGIFGSRPGSDLIDRFVVMRELIIKMPHVQRKLGIWFISIEAEENEQLLHMLHHRN